MNEPSTTPGETPDDDISLLDLAIILAKRKALVLGTPIVFAAVAVAYAMSLPNIYTATAKILPPQQGQSSASAMLSQLGGLAGLAGGGGGMRNPNDLYVGMLKSRTVADGIIQRFDLNKRYGEENQAYTRLRLAMKTSLTAGRDNIISIDVEDTEPKQAAELANAYVDELYKLTKVLAVTEASQRRLFFERQLVLAKDNLAKAESVARQALAESGLVKVDDQGRSLVENVGRLRGQIVVTEVQIGAMRAFAAEANPDLKAAQMELEALKREAARMEGDDAGLGKATAVQGRGMDNLRKLRDVKYAETVYELLARQYEAAKLDEARDASLIQVLDKATIPEVKSKPNRSQIMLVAVLLGLLVGSILAFLKEFMVRMHSDPQKAEKCKVLRHSLRWRRNA